MTIRPRAVRALRDVRERLRDVAATSHASAASARDRSAGELALENQRLEASLDDASTALASATTIHDLDRIADTTGFHQLAVVAATARRDEAIAITEITAGKLRERTRQLRSAEKLVTLLEEHKVRTEARTEQHANDDMSARRR